MFSPAALARDARLTTVLSIARMFVSGAGVALAVFHAWLFAGQIAQGRLSDPGLILRWILAGGVVAALAWSWRRGESLVGRRAVAVWVLAALLHGPAVAERQAAAFNTPSLPEAIVSVLQAVATAAAAGLLLLGMLALKRPRTALAYRHVVRRHVSFDHSGRTAAWSFAPRPPPRA